jgi:hypothetical protein
VAAKQAFWLLERKPHYFRGCDPRAVGVFGVANLTCDSGGRRVALLRSPDWLKMKNPACSAMKQEAEEDWGR